MFDLSKTPPTLEQISTEQSAITKRKGAIRRWANPVFAAALVGAIASLLIPGSDPDFLSRTVAGLVDNSVVVIFLLGLTVAAAFLFGVADTTSRVFAFGRAYVSIAASNLGLLRLVSPGAFCQDQVDATLDLIVGLLWIATLTLTLLPLVGAKLKRLQQKIAGLSLLPESSRIYELVAMACENDEDCRRYVQEVIGQGRGLAQEEANRITERHWEIESKKEKKEPVVSEESDQQSEGTHCQSCQQSGRTCHKQRAAAGRPNSADAGAVRSESCPDGEHL